MSLYSDLNEVLTPYAQRIKGLAQKNTELKADLGALDEDLESQQILQKTYIPVKVIESATINSSGVIVSTAGYNVYVYKVQSGKNIRVTGGDIYALYADEPVKGTSQSIDSVRHQGGLRNTAITMPSGANYIAVRYTTAPTVVADVVPLGVSVDALESDVETVQSFLSTPLSFSFNGFINSSGVFISNNAYRATDYIPVTDGGTYIPLKYRVKLINTVQFAFYDGQKAFIKAVQLTTSTSLVEVEGVLGYVSGAVYVRLCSYSGSGSTTYSDYYADYSDIKNTVTGIIPYPTDYAGSEISVFNKILCIGDSLTSGTFNYRVGSSTSNYIEYAKYSYPTYLKKITGCDVTNLGNGGRTSLEWYNLHVNDDLSGYDCAIIQLGVNDVGRYGTWGQDSIDGFSGIINKLKTENANIEIFVSNIIPARSYHTDGYISMSDAIKTYIEGLNDPQIILLDMQRYGHTYDSDAYNCGHLSALGYQRLAQDYKSYISYHVFMHKTDFKEVQFVGTAYYYDN